MAAGSVLDGRWRLAKRRDSSSRNGGLSLGIKRIASDPRSGCNSYNVYAVSLPSSPEEIYLQRWQIGGLKREPCARLLGVSVRTLRAWESGARRIPAAAWMWLKTVTAGFPLQGAAWEGWIFKNGKFVSPEGVEIGIGQINALPYTYGRLAELEKQVSCNKVVPFQRRAPDLDKLRHRFEFTGRLTTIVRAIATLEADLQEEFDDSELQALSAGMHRLLETACGHYLPFINLTRCALETSRDS